MCRPDPSGKVPFEPVHAKLIEMYGSAADHPNLLEAFRFTLVQGGKGSAPLKDLADFTSIFVDQKKRKMRYEAYAEISKYPEEFPLLRNASTKMAWSSNETKTGWCPLPVSLGHRLDRENKFSWYKLMLDIEALLFGCNWLGENGG